MSAKNTNAPDSPLRRKTIKTLAAGVGALAGTSVLPDKWVTPVIQGIALPAHAQTSAVTFCSGRHELTLVDGHSGTDEMIIEASGCITPAQANVELEMTLEGYDTPAITRNDQNAGPEAGSLLAAVSDALVPSAHAAPAPKCTVKVKVKTDGNGHYKATFKLNCGKGIVQAVMSGAIIGGGTTINLGWLDIPACNPCAVQARGNDCAGSIMLTAVAPLNLSVDSGTTWHQSIRLSTPTTLEVKNTSTASLDIAAIVTMCDEPGDESPPSCQGSIGGHGTIELGQLDQSDLEILESLKIYPDDGTACGPG
ncbi:MAG: hypothetical protein D3909_02850 [Candidatus Electrothrix sp. ATG1]|nr:hypothetical protein [Candidatus Electrothrix sp. ATG1]